MSGLSLSLGIPNTVPHTSVIERASGTNSRWEVQEEGEDQFRLG